MSSYSDSITMRYAPAPRQRSHSSLRTPSLLPDISEHSPSRTPSPPQVLRRQTHVRSVSVASFLSDGTIEIEGFGFDNISELGDDASIFGGDSVYADSVFDGPDNEDGAGIPRPHTPSDLSWRAERILANAKKKLDLCGQNISRARSSLILSPSTTPTSFHEQLDGVKAMPALHSHRFRFRNDGAVNGGPYAGGNTHLRTNSESAVPYTRKGVVGSRSSSRVAGDGDGLGTIEDVDEHPERPQSEQSTSPSKSTQQMRVLRDQMKDLRGKITSLQQQAKSDSMKRRSMTSLRSTPNPYEAPTLDEIRTQDSTPEPGETWENAEEVPDDYSSTRSGTPRAFRRSASPFEARHEDREDAFSYDALFYGNGIYAPSSTSPSKDRHLSYSSDESAATVLEPPRIRAMRRDSFGSIDSFATAAEDRSSSAEGTQLPDPTPPLTVPGDWLSPALRDDGYHSAPHTPRSPYHKDSSSSLASDANKSPVKIQPKYYPVHSAYPNASDTSIDAVMSESRLRRKPGISTQGDMALSLGKRDRELIEGVIEGLGTVCAGLEMETSEGGRVEWRRRLEGALKVLRGDVSVGEGEDECF